MFAPVGRGPKLGDGKRRAKRYQPDCQSAVSASLIGAETVGIVAMRCGDAQARNPIANLSQAQAEARGGSGSVEACFLQRPHQDLALLLVQIALQVAWYGGRRPGMDAGSGRDGRWHRLGKRRGSRLL